MNAQEIEERTKLIASKNFELLQKYAALEKLEAAINNIGGEFEMLQKKAALERLEVAINTFDDEACFLKLSGDGNTVKIHFIGGGTKTVNVRGDSGIAMLYDVLKQGFFE